MMGALTITTVDEAEGRAIAIVEKKRGKVEDVKEEHRRQFGVLLREERQGGVPLQEEASSQEILAEIEQRARLRDLRLGGHHLIEKLPGRAIGQQDDRTRVITYAGKAVHSSVSAELQEGLQRHETAHQEEEVEAGESSEGPEQVFTQCRAEVARALQDRGFDQEIPEDIPLSLFTEIEESEEWQLGRIAYRERHAVKKGEGVANTSEEYRSNYIEPTNKVEQILGSDGARLVEDAGLTQQGFRRVRAKLLGISIAEQLEKK